VTAEHRPSLPAAGPVLLAALLALLGLSWSVPRAGAQDAADAPSLTVVDQTAWVGPTGTFRLRLDAEGLPDGATLRFELHNRVLGRSQFAQTVSGENLGATLKRSSPVPVPGAAPGPDGAVVVTLPVSDTFPAPEDGVVLQGPGVYPFVVEVADAGGSTVARLVTHLVRLDDEAATTTPLAVGVVVPLDGEVVPAPDGSPELTDAGVDRLTARIDTLDELADVRLTLTPSPESLQLLQGRAPAVVSSLTSAIAGRQVLAGPYAPIDSGAWVAADLGPQMDEQHATGTQELGALLSPYRPDATTAVLDPTVTPEALDDLAGRGVRSVVVPTAQVESPSDGSAVTEQFEVATADGTRLPAVASDDTVARLLGEGDDPVRAGHLALADLAITHLSAPTGSRGVALVVPPSAEPAALAALLDGLHDKVGASSGAAGAPMVSPVTLQDLFAIVDVDRGGNGTRTRDYRADAPGDLGRYPDALRQAERQLTGLRSMVPSDAEVAASVNRTLLSSGSRTLDGAERSTMVSAAQASVADTTGEIVVAPEQVVTLTSSSGQIPLNLENRLPVEATVRIVMNSAKLDFPQGAVIDETLAPAQTTTIDLPVETRASGAFPLDVAIISPDGNLAVASTRYTVRSTAVSGIGLLLSVGAGLFLVVWWARHFRTARRARKLVGSGPAADTGAGAGGYAPPDNDPTEGR
jgi:hypothetical protein